MWWCTLVQVYFSAIRELYEALVVYSFMRLMIDFLSQRALAENTDVVTLLVRRTPHRRDKCWPTSRAPP